MRSPGRHSIASFALALLVNSALLSHGSETFTYQPYQVKEVFTGEMPELDRSPLSRETLLIEDAQSRCLIAYPTAEKWQNRAETLARSIEHKTGVRIPVKSAESLSEDDYRSFHMITFGNLMNHPLVPKLYAYWYVFADAAYPGKGNWIMRTIADPFGYGKNFIFLGASTDEDLERALTAFERRIPGDDRWVFPFTIKLHEDEPFPGVTREIGYESPEQLWKQTGEDIANGYGNRLVTTMKDHVWAWWLTGEKKHLEYLRAYMDQHLNWMNRGNQATAGVFLDKHLTDLVCCWDLAEESEMFSDQERLKFAKYLYRLAYEVSNVNYLVNAKGGALRWNHETYPARSIYFCGEYFRKYYRLPIAEEWLEKAHFIFEPMAHSFKSQEDGRSHSGGAFLHSMRYFIASGNMGFFTSGKAREFAEFLHMTVDNLGYQSGFGRSGGFDTKWLYQYLFPVAWYYDDPAIISVDRSSRHKAILRDEPGVYTSDLLPVDLSGGAKVRSAPLHPYLYEKTIEGNWGLPGMREGKTFTGSPPPSQTTFDKLVIRNGFDSSDQYLLLDGLGRGFGSNLDANSIVRMTDNDRVWLISTGLHLHPRFQNSMLVLRDGESIAPPALANIENKGFFKQVGFTQTLSELPDGTRWRRSIVWRPEKHFTIFDQVCPPEPSQVGLQLYWRSLGKPTLEGQQFEIEQEGEKLFRIINLDGARLRVVDDEEEGQANWTTYPYARPVVRTLYQLASKELDPNRFYTFSNVLYCPDVDEPGMIEARRLNDLFALVKEGDEISLIGIGAANLPEFETLDALHANKRSVAVVGAKGFSMKGTALFRCDSRIDMEIDLQQGTGTIVSGEQATVLIPVDEVPRVFLNEEEIDSETADGFVRFAVPEGRHTFRFSAWPRGKAFAAKIEERLVELWESAHPPQALEDERQWKQILEVNRELSPTDEKVSSLAPCDLQRNGSEELLVGTAGGEVLLLDSKGEPRWSFETGGKINAIEVERLRPGDEPTVLVASDDTFAYALTPAGDLKWKFECHPWYGREAKALEILAADLDNDGVQEVLVGGGSWYVFCLNPEGEMLWEHEVYAWECLSMAVGNLDGDETKDIAVGMDYYTVNTFDSSGEDLWRYNMPGSVYPVHLADLNDDGLDEVICAGADAMVHAFEPKGEKDRGVHRWKRSIGDETVHMMVEDIDADGILDIVAAPKSMGVTAFDCDGERLWRYELTDLIKSMILVDLYGDKTFETLVCDWEGRIHVIGSDGTLVGGVQLDAPVTDFALGAQTVYGIRGDKILVLGW